jgi:hypothetical protein
MDDKQIELQLRVAGLLIESRIGWFPKNDKEWAAAVLLFKAGSRSPRKQRGRPVDPDEYWWTILWCAAVFQSGMTDNEKGMPNKSKAFELTAQAAEDMDLKQPLDEKTIEYRWRSKNNPFRDFDFSVKDPRLTEVIEEFIIKWKLRTGFKRFFPEQTSE